MEPGCIFNVLNRIVWLLHNVMADAFARRGEEPVWELVQERSFAVLDVEAAWAEHLNRGWRRRALAWEGQDPG